MPSDASSVTTRGPINPELINLELIFGFRAIDRKIGELGGEAALGKVTRREPGAVYFESGCCVVYNAALRSAFQIKGPIYVKWTSLGGVAWGIPDTDELAAPDGVGRFNHFNGNKASIYWTPQTGANAIWGAIRQKWAEMGWERSPLGYPATDETKTPDGIGRFNHFSKGGSIYWTPRTGAQAIWGAIRARWAELGWERSYLGYPTSDESDFPEGGRANSFEQGGIYWWPDTGAIDLRDVVIHYTGLMCFDETDWDQASNSDEPYVLMSVASPTEVITHRSRVYEDVDGREARPDLIEIYRGKPYGVVIGTVVMESDFGDPNRYREQVQQTVMAVHSAGTTALKAIPKVGPILAAVAGPMLGALMPALGGAINDAFNWGDDRIGSANVTISAKAMVMLAARTKNSEYKGIGFKVETPLIAGSGASYKAYFGIVPA